MERIDVSGVAGEVVHIMNWLKRLTGSPRLLVWLALIVFMYSWLVGLLLQLWVIPTLFSQPGAAEGLVILDSIGFDRIAKAKVVEIANLGWSAWELRPYSQSPAGIASLFYAMFGPSPYSVLPFNAAVHALSACAAMLILRYFFTVVPSLIGALVFALNPASLEWVAQIHRDGIFILGNLLFIYGVMNFFRSPGDGGSQWPHYIFSTVLMPVIGIALVWVARPYWIQVMLVTMLLMLIPWALLTMSRRLKMSRCHIAGLATLFVSVVALQLWLVKFHTPYEPILIPEVVSAASVDPLASTNDVNAGTVEAKSFSWKRTSWIPDVIEGRFYRVAIAREGAKSQGGNTLVDANKYLDSTGAMLGYIPRALQLGMFSPFPELWGGGASTPAMTMARKVVGGVTLIFYVCLIGLVIGLWKLRRNVLVWVMVGICLIGILTYALTYPNIGTLMRYRYGFYMLLIGFGLASWWELWIHRSIFRDRG